MLNLSVDQFYEIRERDRCKKGSSYGHCPIIFMQNKERFTREDNSAFRKLNLVFKREHLFSC